MTSLEFAAWRAAMGWTQVDAARQLGIGKATVALYEAGRRYERSAPTLVKIPRVVELACRALRSGLTDIA